MATQLRKTEIFTLLREEFPSAYVREYSYGFFVFLVPTQDCTNRIVENCPVQISIDFIDGSDDIKIRTQLDVLPSNKMYFCENASKKHKLNVTVKAGKSITAYVQKLKTALAVEGTNIIGNDQLQLQKYFV